MLHVGVVKRLLGSLFQLFGIPKHSVLCWKAYLPTYIGMPFQGGFTMWLFTAMCGNTALSISEFRKMIGGGTWKGGLDIL